MYEATLRSIAKGDADSDHRAVACRALAVESAATNPEMAAWVHRRAMDIIIDRESGSQHYPSYARGHWPYEGSCTLDADPAFFDGMKWCDAKTGYMTESGMQYGESAEDEDPSPAHGLDSPVFISLIGAVIVLLVFIAYLLLRKQRVVVVGPEVDNKDVVVGREVNGASAKFGLKIGPDQTSESDSMNRSQVQQGLV
jgi:hypothetical protein